MMRDRPQFTCVIDPSLALTQHGLSIAQQLAQEIELWIAREFWRILDNPTFYLQHPELLTPNGMGAAQHAEQKHVGVEETLRSLQKWEQFGRSQDLARLNLFWIGDSPEDSYLPKNRSLDTFWQWESIAQSLDRNIEPIQAANNIIPLFVRDTVALAATLGSATILTYKQAANPEQNLPPQICQILEQWGFPCEAITINDSMVKLERKALHRILVKSNTAKFLWSGVNLAVLHLLTSVNFKTNTESDLMSVSSCSFSKDLALKTNFKDLPSVNTVGFWYLL
jgi:hypothetical protein